MPYTRPSVRTRNQDQSTPQTEFKYAGIFCREISSADVKIRADETELFISFLEVVRGILNAYGYLSSSFAHKTINAKAEFPHSRWCRH